MKTTRLEKHDGKTYLVLDNDSGGLRISTNDLEFEEQMKIAKKVMQDSKDALKALK